MSGVSSRNLSFGDRPVRSPVMHTIAPFEASFPSPDARALSTSSAEERFMLECAGDRFSDSRVEAIVSAPLKCPRKTGHKPRRRAPDSPRSEEHTSELQSRGLISYAVFCLK